MKATKLISILTCLFVAIQVFNAQKISKNIEVTSNKIVNRLNVEVNLTDSQKNKIKEKTILYLQNTDKSYQTKSDSTKTQNITAFEYYKLSVDSVLTQEQKLKIVAKRNERIENAKKQYKTNKK